MVHSGIQKLQEKGKKNFKKIYIQHKYYTRILRSSESFAPTSTTARNNSCTMKKNYKKFTRGKNKEPFFLDARIALTGIKKSSKMLLKPKSTLG